MFPTPQTIIFTWGDFPHEVRVTLDVAGNIEEIEPLGWEPTMAAWDCITEKAEEIAWEARGRL